MRKPVFLSFPDFSKRFKENCHLQSMMMGCWETTVRKSFWGAMQSVMEHKVFSPISQEEKEVLSNACVEDDCSKH